MQYRQEASPIFFRGCPGGRYNGSLSGAFVWPSLIRKLDRMDTNYKT